MGTYPPPPFLCPPTVFLRLRPPRIWSADINALQPTDRPSNRPTDPPTLPLCEAFSAWKQARANVNWHSHPSSTRTRLKGSSSDATTGLTAGFDSKTWTNRTSRFSPPRQRGVVRFQMGHSLSYVEVIQFPQWIGNPRPPELRTFSQFPLTIGFLS